MDTDPEARENANLLFKTTFLTLVFSFTQCSTDLRRSFLIALPKQELRSQKNDKEAPVGKRKTKTIFLTFDDGPNKGTRNVMDIAVSEEIPVTMFFVGEHVYGSSWQRQTYDSVSQCNYVEIANHSYSHASHNHFEKFYYSPSITIADFVQCADSLGISSRIIRMPGRNIWRTENISSTDIKRDAATADSIQKAGFIIIGWDIEWHYNNTLSLCSTSAEMLAQIDSIFSKGETKTPNELVLLAHDQVYADAGDSAELHKFVQQLKNSGEYNFETINKYPGINSY